MRDYVIYFSLNAERRRLFNEFVKGEGFCYQPENTFCIVKDCCFDDPLDLITLIEGFDNRANLHIIIDYLSCRGKKKDNYSSSIRDIIMAYPEVQFLFDETFKYESRFGFLDFLFDDGVDQIEPKADQNKSIFGVGVLSDFHCFNMGNNQYPTLKQFLFLLKGRDNIYDASNLRAAIKQYKFNKLHVTDNYEKLNKSRCENAAIVVEEEYHQAMFNGYCLYANGYRVFPIMTATELKWINEQDIIKDSKTLLVRDYDLQFFDEDNSRKREECNNNKQSDDENKNYNTVDWTRGAKKVGTEEKFILLNKNNPFWGKFKDDSTFFITKGDDDVEVKLKSNKPMDVKKGKLILRGIKKPIEGIYASVQQFDCVKECYVSSRDKLPFVTNRREGNHSCPLNIYGIARSMVHRAENYYYGKNYRLAAVVAGEALLVLNGFHRSLMCRAYYIQAVSENAIAMSLLGGEEERLQEDINIRLGNKLQEEVARLIKSPDRKNLLYNIYNDCMLFCKEKEYFNAADEVLNIMVQVKEGVDPIKWFKDIIKRIKK